MKEIHHDEVILDIQPHLGMKKLIKNKNKGILFWVSGLTESGKITIAKKIKKDIINNYGPTLLVSGDNLRKIFNFKKYI